MKSAVPSYRQEWDNIEGQWLFNVGRLSKYTILVKVIEGLGLLKYSVAT